MIARATAVIPITPTADLTGKEGYFVLPTGALVTSATTAVPLGVVAEGFPTTGKSTVVCANFGGTVKVKLGAAPGSVIVGSYLVLNADATAKLDPGTGARIRVARALETGNANELIEAVLCEPAILA